MTQIKLIVAMLIMIVLSVMLINMQKTKAYNEELRADNIALKQMVESRDFTISQQKKLVEASSKALTDLMAVQQNASLAHQTIQDDTNKSVQDMIASGVPREEISRLTYESLMKSWCLGKTTPC